MSGVIYLPIDDTLLGVDVVVEEWYFEGVARIELVVLVRFPKLLIHNAFALIQAKANTQARTF